MAVRSRRLALTSKPSGGGHVVFTCPAGRTALLKTAALQLVGSGNRTIELAVQAPAGAGYVSLVSRPNVVPGTDPVLLAGLDVVLEPGDALVVWSSGDGLGSLRLGAWGALLSGAPT